MGITRREPREWVSGGVSPCISPGGGIGNSQMDVSHQVRWIPGDISPHLFNPPAAEGLEGAGRPGSPDSALISLLPQPAKGRQATVHQVSDLHFLFFSITPTVRVHAKSLHLCPTVPRPPCPPALGVCIRRPPATSLDPLCPSQPVSAMGSPFPWRRHQRDHLPSGFQLKSALWKPQQERRE